MMDTTPRFPFGLPILPCKPSASEPRRVFVLGAYPSALHVRWTPPAGLVVRDANSRPEPLRPIRAVAVDNEPEPFWNGEGQERFVEAWKTRVEWRDSWGTVEPAGRLNGSSGAWVDENILAPGVTRSEACVTDCLNSYRCSADLAARLEDTYRPFAEALRLPWPFTPLPTHPGEDEIVRESLASHKSRLARELEAARPELVVSLGNAALRVLREVVESADADAPGKLAVEGYGRRLSIRLAGRSAEWLPLAHPAAPKQYQDAHEKWTACAAAAGE